MQSVPVKIHVMDQSIQNQDLEKLFINEHFGGKMYV